MTSQVPTEVPLWQSPVHSKDQAAHVELEQIQLSELRFQGEHVVDGESDYCNGMYLTQSGTRTKKYENKKEHAEPSSLTVLNCRRVFTDTLLH